MPANPAKGEPQPSLIACVALWRKKAGGGGVRKIVGELLRTSGLGDRDLMSSPAPRSRRLRAPRTSTPTPEQSNEEKRICPYAQLNENTPRFTAGAVPLLMRAVLKLRSQLRFDARLVHPFADRLRSIFLLPGGWLRVLPEHTAACKAASSRQPASISTLMERLEANISACAVYCAPPVLMHRFAG